MKQDNLCVSQGFLFPARIRKRAFLEQAARKRQTQQLTGKETYKLNSTSASKPNCRDCGDDWGLQEENWWLNFEVCEEIKKKNLYFIGY